VQKLSWILETTLSDLKEDEKQKGFLRRIREEKLALRTDA